MKKQDILLFSVPFLCAILAGIYLTTRPPVLAQSGTFQACYVQGGTGTLNSTANHANCRNFSSFFGGLRAVNTSGTIAYVELYNSATDIGATPTATNFQECIPIPASTTGAGIVDIAEVAGGNSGLQYTNGVSYIINGSCSTSSAVAPPAGVYITIFLR